VAPWIVFALSAAAVAGAGYRLARDGDVIAEGTGLGGMWVGAILVAGATSLPELLTDTNAVLQGRPSLAVGDLFGSNMANMMLLAAADLMTRHTRILTRVAVNQALIGTLAICLTAVAAIGLAIGPAFAVGLFGPATLVVGVGYVGGMYILGKNRDEPPFRTPEQAAEARPPRKALRSAVLGFGAAALVILVAAPYLAQSSADVAQRLGIAEGFAGMLLLALVTSLPEAAVSATSVRAGAYQLAVGNLLGSNCFNMAALVPLDVVHGTAPILGDVAPELAIGALFAILLMGMAMMDVLNKSERRVWLIEPWPAFMLLTYLVGLTLMHTVTTP
jgi:cation:H+ antiporter